ncbi:MAG: metallophosphoesterase [Elusimicrobiota bacterium]
MLIGLISDTHDNLPQVRKAVEYFNGANVDLVFHAGDIISPFNLQEYKKLKARVVFVFGNNDGEKYMWRSIVKEIGEVHEVFYEARMEELAVLMMHEPWQIDALAESQKFDIIIHGHTHKPAVMHIGKTAIINPGECGGWVSGKSTVGLLELPSKKFELIELRI